MEVHHRHRLTHALIADLFPESGPEIVTCTIGEGDGEESMARSNGAAANQMVRAHRQDLGLAAARRCEHEKVGRDALDCRELCADWSVGRHRSVALQDELDEAGERRALINVVRAQD